MFEMDIDFLFGNYYSLENEVEEINFDDVQIEDCDELPF